MYGLVAVDGPPWMVMDIIGEEEKQFLPLYSVHWEEGWLIRPYSCIKWYTSNIIHKT